MIVAEAARRWQQLGVSCIPVLDNGTKKPAIRWAPYQVRVPELGEVDQWWGNGRQYGLALICGGISGNLEMTEIEGRAASGDSIVAIENAMDEVGATAIWNQLTTHGYMEMSPSGGLHFLYRITDHDVPGNTKIAASTDQLVLAETRGEGGYVIVAPTTGLCHPSGEGWTLVKGTIGELPELTWAERNLLHAGLRLALGSDTDVESVSTALNVWEAPVQMEPVPPSQVTPRSWAGVSPNDDFEARTDWADILEPHGWRLESKRGRERFWTRPGKDRRDGASATTGLSDDRDRLYVFSTSTVFPTETSITKYMAWTILNFGGDKKAATQELVRRGFGSPVIHAVLDSELEWTEDGPEPQYELNDCGNASRLRDRVEGRYLWMAQESRYYFWDGRIWAPDVKNRLAQEYKAMIRDKLAQAAAKGDAKAQKFWTSCGNAGRLEAALKMMRSEEGIAAEANEMDRGARILNVANGILDLAKQELLPHDKDLRQTRMFGTHWDPEANCPRFMEFIESAVPDQSMRSYIQRALGYSILGDVDQRSMFLIYGPSGTGKSTLMETMRGVFGDYGTTAAAGAFRSRGRDSGGATNDLHGLRGKRFVTTSETAENASFDEDLLKRLTGRDSIQSRELYQSNQEWVPECAIWLATNHPPRFNSDDDAIWRRAKLIPFLTQFLGSGEVPDMARRFLVPEAAGILNWLVAGLVEYLEHGLMEPELVTNSAKDLRASSDSAIRFVDDSVADGSMTLAPPLGVPAKLLYMRYQTWCLHNGERALRMTRFAHRLESGDRGIRHVLGSGTASFSGIGLSGSSGLSGQVFG